MQLNFKSPNSTTFMETSNINADCLNNNTDNELSLCIKLIGKNQDKLAFANIFKYFAPRLKSFLIKAGSTDSQAEEVIQEVMIAVWTKSSTYDCNKSSVSTWIYTIARNKKVDFWRKNSNISVREEDIREFVYKDNYKDESDQREINDQVERINKELTPEQRKMIKMNFFENKSHKIIAAELEIPIGTVKSRIRNILRKMQKIL